MLFAEANLEVRFNEVDMLTIVWHGHYVQYMEEGRIAFGAKYGLGYMEVYKEGYTIPIVKLNIDYKLPLKFTDKIVIKAEYIPTEAAKILFQYSIINSSTNQVVAVAQTTQVFVHNSGDLCLTSPSFYTEWKNKWLIA